MFRVLSSSDRGWGRLRVCGRVLTLRDSQTVVVRTTLSAILFVTPLRKWLGLCREGGGSDYFIFQFVFPPPRVSLGTSSRTVLHRQYRSFAVVLFSKEKSRQCFATGQK